MLYISGAPIKTQIQTPPNRGIPPNTNKKTNYQSQSQHLNQSRNPNTSSWMTTKTKINDLLTVAKQTAQKTIQPIKIIENITSSSHHDNRAQLNTKKWLIPNLLLIPPPLDFRLAWEDTITSPKTWIKKPTSDLKSKVIDLPNSKNKSLRHPLTPDLPEKTP